MKFKVGDKVKFLNEKGSGVISKIDGQGIVYVKDEDGFDFPMTTGEIVLSEPGTNQDSASQKSRGQQQEVAKTASISVAHVDDSQEKIVCLGFRPQDQNRISNSTIEMYIINDSGYHLLFTIHYKEMDVYNYLKMGSLEPDTKVQVKVINQSEITKWSDIRIQVLFTGKGSYEPVSPVDYTFNIARKRFYSENEYTSNDYFEDKALIVPIMPNRSVYEDVIKDQETLREIVQEKELQQRQQTHKSPKPERDIKEVDLHIHELVDDYSSLTNAEMINIQLDTFRRELFEAIQNKKASKIVFIHGVGNGTLKYELRKELERHYSSFRFQDASFKEYGFGATLVYLQ